MPQILKTEALILYGMRWSDTSKIVHLFTAEKGLIKAIARGAMRPKNPLRGIVENLNHVEVILSLKETRGLQIISQATLMNSFSHIRDNLEAISIAYAIFELLRQLVRYNEASNTLFQYTIENLNQLNQAQNPLSLIFLLSFIIFISEYLGFGWNFAECHKCKNTPHHFPVKVDAINGAVYCATHPPLKSVALQETQWKLLLQLQHTPPGNLQKLLENLPPAVNYQSLLDLLISHLNYHTEQSLQLKSLKMYLM